MPTDDNVRVSGRLCLLSWNWICSASQHKCEGSCIRNFNISVSLSAQKSMVLADGISATTQKECEMLAFLYEKNVVHVPAGSKQNGFRKRWDSAILHPDTGCNVTFFDKASMKFKADHSHDTEALDAAASACPPFEISAPLLSNRAQCFLSLEVGSRALADVDCVLRQQPLDQNLEMPSPQRTGPAASPRPPSRDLRRLQHLRARTRALEAAGRDPARARREPGRVRRAGLDPGGAGGP
jgi:hypothetical protein